MRGVVRACEGWPWLGDAPNFGAPVVLYEHKGGLKPKPLRVHSPHWGSGSVRNFVCERIGLTFSGGGLFEALAE